MMEVAVQLESPRRSEIIDVVQSSTAGSESAQLRLTRPNPTSASAQMPDRPCSVILSSSLLIGQAIPSAELVDQTLPETAGRSVHDAVRCVLRTSTGSEIGAITNFGRVHKFPVAELPVLDTARAFSGLDGTSSVNEYLTLDKRETVLNLVALDSSTPIALGTKFGTVKRVLPEVPKSASVYSVIRLDDADEVVGASHARDGELLVFISRAASLLVFPSAKVRPQGRASQGMSGMKLNPSFEGDSVIFFGPVSGAKDTFVVTITASAKTAQKSRQWFGKTTPLTEYPTKGRATSGVRTQKLLKGQSALTFAYTGPGPLGALNAAGLPVELPPLSPKRDASGSRLADTIESIGFLLT
jgi:DNA gyrase subunit A